MNKEQSELAGRIDEQMRQAGYKAVIQSFAEEIWQRPIRKAGEVLAARANEEVNHLKTVFAPEVIVGGKP